ncbi:hypothetical protein SDC9_125508 [bioreactor metagenome]|uniref:Uncharacterized protein n=1 Tax=bioreactor metagenome TaxID=1076179 RepID=A0A645CNK5_9ZZZZ
MVVDAMGMTKGNKKIVMNTLLFLPHQKMPSAVTNASTISSGTLTAMNRNEFLTASKNASLCKSET